MSKKIKSTLLFLILVAVSITSRSGIDAPSYIDTIAPVFASNECLLSRDVADSMTQDEIKAHIEYCDTLIQTSKQ